MAYIHCHDCDWEQDDFWSRRYNPVQTFFSYVKSFRLWIPRTLEGDRPVFPTHSYVFLWRQVLRMLRKFRNMRWWTWKTYKRDREANIAFCPKCGARDLCID
jgi:hypothetical protein